ncbi:hypothetical protein D9M68_425050 [compost metagenome]
MSEFLEERLPVCISYGASFKQRHAVETVTTAGGNEYRRLRHPFVQLFYDIAYARPAKTVREQILDLYERCNGPFRGFRVKDFKDFTTHNYVDAPTAFDQPMLQESPTIPGVYQLMRWYGNPADPSCARRRLRKPVAGTVLVGVGGVVLPAAQWSVDNTTGIVTMAADKIGAITGISKAMQAVFTANNTLAVGETLSPSGILGMTQMNGLRGTVVARTATQFTLDINSTAFSTYTSGGVFNTRPQSGEAVTAGCEFDVPCRFDSDLDGTFANVDFIEVDGINIVELLNP